MGESITVQVDFYATLQKYFGDSPIRVTLPTPATVRSAIEKTADTPERRSQLFDESGTFRKGLTVLKNGRNISFIGGLDAELEAGETLAVFTPTFGG